MNMTVTETGVVETQFDCDEYSVVERFYPLCGMAVETRVIREKEVRVRPDTYLRRATFHTHNEGNT
jgi:hypothetical protein